MNVLLAGGAGFIGSHLADRLLSTGHNVVCLDNLVLGNLSNIQHLINKRNFQFIKEDLSNYNKLREIFERYHFSAVYHLAANSDIRLSGTNPMIEFDNTFLSTYNILECMRQFKIKKLFFSSTSAIYGRMPDIPLHEDSGPLKPVSYYGGAKLASESFISSFSYMNDFKTVIFRFPNVIGSRLTHGVIFDFIAKLKKDPKNLEILGDGSQSKPYMHISDLIDGIMIFDDSANIGVNCYNIGVETTTSVAKIAGIVCNKMGLKDVVYHFTGGEVGWKGDVPRFNYDLTKIYSVGWRAKFSSDEAVRKTLEEVL